MDVNGKQDAHTTSATPPKRAERALMACLEASDLDSFPMFAQLRARLLT